MASPPTLRALATLWPPTSARRSLTLAAPLACVAIAISSCTGGPAPKVENVVLVVVDTLRADHLPVYGYHRDTTPHLNRVFSDSVVFEHCITPVPMTDPAFASLLTGTYPGRHGVRDNGQRVLDEVPMLTRPLRDRGYQTAAFFSRSDLAGTTGLGRAFDLADDRTLAPHERLINDLWSTKQGAERWQRRANEVTDAAIDWLEGREPGPFLVLVHYYDPHAHYDPHPPHLGAFKVEPTPFDHLDLRAWWGEVDSLGETIARYDEEILTVDAQLGRLVKALQRHHLWDQTLLVFTADHGESLGEHGAMDHGEWLWHQQLHVPLAFRIPGDPGPTPRRVSQMVRLFDVLPTILDLIPGLPLASSGPGIPARSLAPLIHGETLRVESILLETESCPSKPGSTIAIGTDCHPPGVAGKARGLFDGRYKLVVTPTRQGRRIELYDVIADPREADNLAAGRPERVATMLAELEAATTMEAQGPVDRGTVERLRALGYAD